MYLDRVVWFLFFFGINVFIFESFDGDGDYIVIFEGIFFFGYGVKLFRVCFKKG